MFTSTKLKILLLLLELRPRPIPMNEDSFHKALMNTNARKKQIMLASLGRN